MGILDKFSGNIDRRLHELAEDARAQAMADAAAQRAEFDLAKAEAEGSITDALNRQRYRYRRASLVDPSIMPSIGEGGYGVYRPRYSHLSNKVLKEMSLRDPIVAAIFQTRINQIARFSKPQENRYDPGFRFTPRDPSVEVKPGSEEEAEIAWLTDYIRNCGSNEDRDPKSKMDFDTFLRLMIRDRLTFGAAAIETIRNHLGGIHSFLPAPTESIYFANKRLPKEIIAQAEASQNALMSQGSASTKEMADLMDAQEDRERQRDDNEDIEFVQVVNGRVHQTFTGKELIYKLGNPQNFIENNGYCIGELEMATLVITGHLQAENYNKLFFTHGFASRGLIHIAGDVSPSQLQAFRAQWYAQVSGNENSWRTPIIAGVDGVEWIPLSATNRDMEYSVYIDHIIRTLSAIFAISPVEIGFEHLGRGQGQGGLGSEDNDTKIQHSQVRGLKPLLTWIETIINEDIIPNVSEEFAAKYRFSFVGLEIESKAEEINRQTAEIGVRSSVNDIRRESGQDPVLSGDIICNPSYYQGLIQLHKVGEIREFLLGYVGDSENPEFNYIADPLYLENLQLIMQAEQQAMMAEAQAGLGGGGEFGDEEADGEDGAEASEEGDEGFGGEPGDESSGGEAPDQGAGAGAEGESGESAPVRKTARSPRQTLRKAQELAKSNYYRQRRIDPRVVRSSLGIMRKAASMGWAPKESLAKADSVIRHQHDKVKSLDGELERARKAHLQAFNRVKEPMVRDILNALKPGGVTDGDESDSE